MKHRAAPTCPRCNSNEDVKKIAYGIVPSAQPAQIERDGYVLGGRCIRPDSPEWYCDACEETFGTWCESWGDPLTDKIQ